MAGNWGAGHLKPYEVSEKNYSSAFRYDFFSLVAGAPSGCPKYNCCAQRDVSAYRHGLKYVRHHVRAFTGKLLSQTDEKVEKTNNWQASRSSCQCHPVRLVD